MLHFVEIRSGLGAAKYGTEQGVALLGEYMKKHHADIPSKVLSNDRVSADGHVRLKNVDSLQPFYQIVATQIENIAKSAVPIIISGDHSNAIATLAGFKNAHADKRVALIWLDAHADMHTVYTTPSGNLHGMPVASALALDNQACHQHAPSDDEVAYWQSLKQLSKQDNLSIDDVFFLGLRSYESPEAHLINHHQIFHYSAQAHRQHGFDDVLQKMIERVQQADIVYVSFDVDALDESLLLATGTHEPNGYRVNEMKQILTKVLTLPNIGAFEMTEFNPTLHDDRSEYQRVCELLLHAVNCLKANQAIDVSGR